MQEVFGQVDDERLERAHAIVAAFEEAEARGVASIQVDGTFVDYPVYDREKRIIALAEA